MIPDKLIDDAAKIYCMGWGTKTEEQIFKDAVHWALEQMKKRKHTEISVDEARANYYEDKIENLLEQLKSKEEYLNSNSIDKDEMYLKAQTTRLDNKTFD